MEPISTRVTIAEVARSVGVSVPTVSKVLNDRQDVATQTRKRVQEALAAHGYQRRMPVSAPPEALVELVIPDLDSPYALEILAGAEARAARAEAGLVVTAAHDHHGEGRQWLGAVASRRPVGVVLVVNRMAGERIGQLAPLHAPLVLVDPVGGADPALPTVGATNFPGGVAATEHLLSLGHRRIAVITGLPYLLCSRERVEGYRAAMARAEVPVDEDLVRCGDFLPGGGQAAADQLLSLADPPTAVFAGSDMQALGVYQEASRRGLRVPEDLSVVGFDDVSFSRYLSPPLTTVHQPLAQMAAEAVRLVLDLAEHGSPPVPVHVQMSTRLVVRESTGPPAHLGN